MPDSTISGLPAATTPLAGTEVVPLDQTGATKKVAVSDLIAYGRSFTTNAQTGTTYTLVSSDRAKLVTFNNASAVAVTLPAASTFGAGWYFYVENRGAGTVTITPTTSTIDGGATLIVKTNQGALIMGDGTNYVTALQGASFDPSKNVASGRFTADAGAVNAQTGTTYTLAATDNGGIVTLSNASAITVTVPSGLGKGFSVICIQIGAGQVTFSPSSTTLNGRNGLKTGGQHAAVSLIAYVADTFNVAGDTTT